MRRHWTGARWAVAGAVAVSLATASLGATDFVRGDFNSDGKVTISDAYRISAYLFRGAAQSPCMLTGDADDDGNINLSDAISLLQFVVMGAAQPAAPYPAPGPDPTAAGPAGDCISYGGVAPLDDPSARIEILDSVANGGAEGTAVIHVRISHSLVVAGYSGRILVDTSAVGYVVAAGVEDLSGTLKAGFSAAKVDNGRLSFGYLISLVGAGDPWFQPEQDKDVLAISVCLKAGAAAGDYPLTLSAAEFADVESGSAIPAQLVSGTLAILSEVAPGAGCESSLGCIVQPPLTPPNPLPDLNARFSLADAIGRPGHTLEMPFLVRADADIQGYAFSVDFDEEVLQAVEVLPTFKQKDGFQRFEVNNSNAHPGSAGIDEGFLIGAMVFSFRDNCHNMPANKDNEAARFKLLVRPETTVDSTQLRFLDGGQGTGQPISNVMTAFGTAITPDLASSFVFVNGVVSVQPDITIFVRGDSNGDGQVEITDAVHTLGFLFLGTEAPYCLDAADSNDDGVLNIADPVATLSYLYLGRGTLPPPFPGEGEDPTVDTMGCSSR